MAKIDAIPTALLDQLKAADTALHNGDPSLRKGMWSHHQPVTLFGAAVTRSGWKAIGTTFDWLASTFSNCTSFAMDVLAAESSGDLAYVVAIEHTVASVGGAPPLPYALRVTTVLRREGGEWKVVHRHGDPYDVASGEQVSRLKDNLPK